MRQTSAPCFVPLLPLRRPADDEKTTGGIFVEQVILGDSRRRRPMQGSNAPTHGFFQGERGPKLVNSVWWCIEV